MQALASCALAGAVIVGVSGDSGLCPPPADLAMADLTFHPPAAPGTIVGWVAVQLDGPATCPRLAKWSSCHYFTTTALRRAADDSWHVDSSVPLGGQPIRLLVGWCTGDACRVSEFCAEAKAAWHPRSCYPACAAVSLAAVPPDGTRP